MISRLPKVLLMLALAGYLAYAPQALGAAPAAA